MQTDVTVNRFLLFLHLFPAFFVKYFPFPQPVLLRPCCTYAHLYGGIKLSFSCYPLPSITLQHYLLKSFMMRHRRICSMQVSILQPHRLSSTELAKDFKQEQSTQNLSRQFSSVQFSSVSQSCPTLRDLMDCSTPGFPVHHQLPEIAQTHVHRIGDAIHPSHFLSSPSPGDESSWQRLNIFPSIRVFSKGSVLHIRWPKYWSFSFHICPSNEYLGLISFMIDWFDLLAVHGTFKSLLQHCT